MCMLHICEKPVKLQVQVYTSACSRSPSVQPSCLQLTSRCPFQLNRNADGSGLLWMHETIYSHAGALRCLLAAQHNFIRTYTPTYICIYGACIALHNFVYLCMIYI